MITSKTPRLDLHGEVCAMVEVLVNDFINENYKLGYDEIIIIHGKSTNILTKEVHRVLGNNKQVKIVTTIGKIIFSVCDTSLSCSILITLSFSVVKSLIIGG